MNRSNEEMKSILNIAREFIDLEAYDECNKLCQKLLSENSTNSEVWSLYGVSCAKMGHIDLAQECFLTSLEINCSDFALANYIQTHLELGNYKLYLKLINKFYSKLDTELQEMTLTNIITALSCRYLFREELPEVIKEELKNIYII